jgi:adenosylmethionine-8-amino-7-oxononanoate aminotransferase
MSQQDINSTATSTATTTLIEQDQRQLHPVFHPSKHQNPLVIESGDGVYLQTTDGRRILDGMAGLWNVNVGYGNQHLPEVAAEQMRKLAYTSNFVGMTNVPSSELAARLAGFAHPTLNTTFFTSGGSESNDSAFKTARYYWFRLGKHEKFKIIARKNAYHGITVAATAATGIAGYQTMFGPMAPGFLHIPAPSLYRYEGDIQTGETVGQAAARALEEAIVREGPETVAAFIAEPIQGVGGVIVPPDDYFPLVRAICDKYEVLLIADEVITGFGRTGAWFGSQLFDLRPDILDFAKGITSGYLQLGGMQISDAIREVIWGAPATESWMHGYTYSGHPAACAVGLANIEILERERLPENAQIMGQRLRAGLEGLLEFPFVGDVRGRGLLNGVEIVKDKESRTPDIAMAARLADMALARGLRTRNVANVLAFAPPLVINSDEVDEIVRILGGVFDSVEVASA